MRKQDNDNANRRRRQGRKKSAPHISKSVNWIPISFAGLGMLAMFGWHRGWHDVVTGSLVVLAPIWARPAVRFLAQHGAVVMEIATVVVKEVRRKGG
jgi:hypothetical protein